MRRRRGEVILELVDALRDGEDDEDLLEDLLDDGWDEDEANELLDRAEEELEARSSEEPDVGPPSLVVDGRDTVRISLRARIVITAVVVLGSWLVRLIPSPAVSYGAVGSLAEWLGAPRLLAPEHSSFGLGLTPFFTSFLVVELFALLFLRGRRLSDGELRQRMTFAAVVIGGLVAFVQGWGTAVYLESIAQSAMPVTAMEPGYGLRLVHALSTTAGSCLLVAVAFLVTRIGLGNGFAVLVGAGLLWNGGKTVVDALSMVGVGAVSLAGTLFGALLCLLFLAAAVRFFLWSSRAAHELPLRLPTSGIVPLMFAASIMTVPFTLLNVAPSPGMEALVRLLWPGSWLYISMEVSVVVVLASLLSWLFYFRHRERWAREEMHPHWRKAWVLSGALLGGVVLYQHVLFRLNRGEWAPLISAVSLVVGAAIAVDLYRELQARRALGPKEELLPVEVHHDVSAAVEAATRRSDEGKAPIENETYRTPPYLLETSSVVVVQGLCYRSLFYFFAPWAPMVILSGTGKTRVSSTGGGPSATVME